MQDNLLSGLVKQNCRSSVHISLNFKHFTNTLKIVILSIFLYWCGTLFLAFREEHRLGAFENLGISRLLGSERDNIIGKK
jgi:hypothetical protein